MNEQQNLSAHESKNEPTSSSVGKILKWILTGVILITLAIAAWYGWAYTKTLPQVRMPQSAHYHFRLQIINNGKPVNFADNAFQTPYDKFSCTVDLPEQPIHFHDNVDQFVHIHWQGITGGMLLKQYGWNEIGGPSRMLGYRFDQGLLPKPVKTHGNVLPERLEQINYYLYTGDQTSHALRNWQDFLQQELEIFFEDSSSANSTDIAPTSTGNLDLNSNPNLTLLNNLMGNAVLFVQKDPPTEEQVQKYFNQLVPLPESTCGG